MYEIHEEESPRKEMRSPFKEEGEENDDNDDKDGGWWWWWQW